MKHSFIKCGYPAKFVQSVIDSFNKPKEDEPIIPVHGFNERPKIGIRLPFCQANEKESRKFITKLNEYTNWKFNFYITW